MEHKKVRYSYFDIAKGCMMIFLIFHHIADFSFRNFAIYNNTLLNIFSEIQRPIMLCYFMQAFFVITGICSNFNVGFGFFLKKQIKTLLFPALLITTAFYAVRLDFCGLLECIINNGCRYWFIVALFLSKIAYWWLLRLTINKNIVLIVLLLFSFLGTLLHQYDIIPNIWYFFQFSDLALFIAIGQKVKTMRLTNKHYLILFLVYLATVLWCYLTGVKIPHVTAGFSTTIYSWPIHLLLATCGTFLLLKISIIIDKQPVIEYIGKNSLVIYMFHDVLLGNMLKVFAPLLMSNSLFISTIVIFSIFFTVMGCMCILSHILNYNHVKWILGK